MKEPTEVHEDADMAYAEAALQRAAKNALDLGRRTHTPVWVVKDGVLVDLTAEGGEADRTPAGEDRS